MNKNKLLLFLICFIIAAPQSYTQSTNSQIKQLVGKWKSIHNKEKGVEINIKFNADGSVKYSVSVNLKGDYLLKGNKLISYLKNLGTNDTVVDTSIIKFIGNTLIQRSLVSGNTIKLTRLDKAKNNSNVIIGKWESENYNGYRTITEYNAYYGINVQLLVKSIEGSFVVEKNMVTIFSPKTYRMRLNYKITKNIMTLHNLENGKDLTMVRLAK